MGADLLMYDPIYYGLCFTCTTQTLDSHCSLTLTQSLLEITGKKWLLGPVWLYP